MLPEGQPYTEEQLQEMSRLYGDLKTEFVRHRNYLNVLLQKVQTGIQLDEKELKDMTLFVKISETISGLEELIVSELSASIIGICEEAKLRARDGDPEWEARWKRMAPIYNWYMEVYTQRMLPRN